MKEWYCSLELISHIQLCFSLTTNQHEHQQQPQKLSTE